MCSGSSVLLSNVSQFSFACAEFRRDWTSHFCPTVIASLHPLNMKPGGKHATWRALLQRHQGHGGGQTSNFPNYAEERSFVSLCLQLSSLSLCHPQSFPTRPYKDSSASQHSMALNGMAPCANLTAFSAKAQSYLKTHPCKISVESGSLEQFVWKKIKLSWLGIISNIHILHLLSSHGHPPFHKNQTSTVMGPKETQGHGRHPILKIWISLKKHFFFFNI